MSICLENEISPRDGIDSRGGGNDECRECELSLVFIMKHNAESFASRTDCPISMLEAGAVRN